MASVLCSIVMPTYNVRDYIADAIESVLSQSLKAWELIIVDDGSKDGTVDVAESYVDSRIRVIRVAHAGVCVARNCGLAACIAEFVLFLDGDDMLASDALERMISRLEASSDLIAVYGEAVRCDEAGMIFGSGKRPFFTPRPSGQVLRHLLCHNFMITGTVCARTCMVQRTGGFVNDLELAEDWVLWCCLATLGPIEYLGGPPVLMYRVRATSTIAKIGTDMERTRRAIDYAFGLPQIRQGVAEALDDCYRERVASAHAYVGTQHLRERRWGAAALDFCSALRLQPMRPRELILLMCSILRILPRSIETRLK